MDCHTFSSVSPMFPHYIRINVTHQSEFASSKNTGPMTLCALTAHQTYTLMSYKGTSSTAGEFETSIFVILAVCIPI